MVSNLNFLFKSDPVEIEEKVLSTNSPTSLPLSYNLYVFENVAFFQFSFILKIKYCSLYYEIKRMVIKKLGDSLLLARTAFTMGKTKATIPIKISIKIPKPNNNIAGMLMIVNNINVS